MVLNSFSAVVSFNAELLRLIILFLSVYQRVIINGHILIYFSLSRCKTVTGRFPTGQFPHVDSSPPSQFSPRIKPYPDTSLEIS